MPVILLLLAGLGLVFFAVRLGTDPSGWLVYALGVGASLSVGARNLKVIRTNRKIASMPDLQEIRDPAALDAVLALERAVVYKHSTSCPVSATVIDDVLRFAEQSPDWPVYLLKVIEHRDLSDAVAERLGVRHASPQVLLLRQGRSVWDASHYAITAPALRAQAV